MSKTHGHKTLAVKKNQKLEDLWGLWGVVFFLSLPVFLQGGVNQCSKNTGMPKK